MVIKSKIIKISLVIFGLFIIFWYLPVVPLGFKYSVNFQKGKDFFIKKNSSFIEFNDVLTPEQNDFWINQEDVKISPKNAILPNGRNVFDFACLNDYDFFKKWTTDQNLIKECDLLRKNNIKK